MFEIGDAWVLPTEYDFAVGVEGDGVLDHITDESTDAEAAAFVRKYAKQFGWPRRELAKHVATWRARK